ncbi:hypothetical protein IWQ60_001657 [Tieghemiomyces parasiticus]|uniref:FCP1 homology domain-containing protein n=1 Tax=Tieghemiomyces parasiticus TaxID=78921 RepID=A0A9W8AJF1_9FUNG|nr:hypothetical protein IWQ60_001657 [Tieghemiomyces parasiticus]
MTAPFSPRQTRSRSLQCSTAIAKSVAGFTADAALLRSPTAAVTGKRTRETSTRPRTARTPTPDDLTNPTLPHPSKRPVRKASQSSSTGTAPSPAVRTTKRKAERPDTPESSTPTETDQGDTKRRRRAATPNTSESDASDDSAPEPPRDVARSRVGRSKVTVVTSTTATANAALPPTGPRHKLSARARGSKGQIAVQTTTTTTTTVRTSSKLESTPSVDEEEDSANGIPSFITSSPNPALMRKARSLSAATVPQPALHTATTSLYPDGDESRASALVARCRSTSAAPASGEASTSTPNTAGPFPMDSTQTTGSARPPTQPLAALALKPHASAAASVTLSSISAPPPGPAPLPVSLLPSHTLPEWSALSSYEVSQAFPIDASAYLGYDLSTISGFDAGLSTAAPPGSSVTSDLAPPSSGIDLTSSGGTFAPLQSLFSPMLNFFRGITPTPASSDVSTYDTAALDAFVAAHPDLYVAPATSHADAAGATTTGAFAAPAPLATGTTDATMFVNHFANYYPHLANVGGVSGVDTTAASTEHLTSTDSTTTTTSSVPTEEDDEEEDEDEDAAYDPATLDALTLQRQEEAVYSFIAALPPVPRDLHIRPFLLPRKTRSSPPITLVLDLDETLVHCSTLANFPADFTFMVENKGQEFTVRCRLRPGYLEFLERMAQHFEVVIFTASQKAYADRLLNLLDPQRNLIRHRLFRDSCLELAGSYLKDLSLLGRDLSKVVIVDNSPQVFGYQVSNGIPIVSWYQDPGDNELRTVGDFLETLVGVDDVRPHIDTKYRMQERVDSVLQSIQN